MSNHCSVETARALWEAGLRREWQIGDWVAYQRINGRWDKGLVDEVGEPCTDGPANCGPVRLLHMVVWRQARGRQVRPEGMNTVDTGCVWLPTPGQLLEELAGREYRFECDRDCDGRYHVRVWKPETTDWHSHEQLVEAAGQALLAVLRGEGEDE